MRSKMKLGVSLKTLPLDWNCRTVELPVDFLHLSLIYHYAGPSIRALVWYPNCKGASVSEPD